MARLHIDKWLITGFILLFLLMRLPVFFGWDDAFYMSQLVSVVSDGDYMLQDELLAFPNHEYEKFMAITNVFNTGAVRNDFSVGFAVVQGIFSWPFILAYPDNPYSDSLRVVFALTAMLILCLTAVFISRILQMFGYERATAHAATGMMIVGGPLLYYGTRSYINSHLLSAFWVTFLVYNLLRFRESGRRISLVLVGLSAGMMTITRWQNMIFLLLCVLPGMRPAGGSNPGFRKRVRYLVPGFAAFLLPVAIQILAWHIQFNTWVFMPQGGGFMHWFSPGIIPLLVSGYHGLIPWSPGFFIGLVGLFFLKRRNPNADIRQIIPLFSVMVLIHLYISACPDWWSGTSYGQRRLTSLTLFAALGFAGIYRRLHPKLRVLLIIFLCAWAFFTLNAFHYQLDDLTMLLLHRPDPFNMHPEQIHSGRTWKTPWIYWRKAFRKMINHRFALHDDPHGFRKWIGGLFVLCVMILSGLFSAALTKSNRWEKILAALFFCWLLVVAGVLLRLPGNNRWNALWLDVVDGRPVQTASFPRDVPDAAHLVYAVRYAAQKDPMRFRSHFSRIRHPEKYNLDPQSLLHFVRSSRGKQIIRKNLFELVGKRMRIKRR